MADPERTPESSIIGRDAAREREAADGDRLKEQLNETTAESAGGSVSGTGDEECAGDFDIIFEPEGSETEAE